MVSPAVIRIGPDSLQQFGWLSFASLMFAGSFTIMVSLFGGFHWLSTSGWPIVAIAAAVLVFGIILISAIRGRPCVEIGPDGFVTRGPFTSRSYCWAEIEGEFAVIKFGWQALLRKAVVFRLVPGSKSRVAGKPIPHLAGYDAAVGSCLRIPAGELAALLNKQKQLNDPSGAVTSAPGDVPIVSVSNAKFNLKESYPSWAGLALAPPCCAMAGWLAARDTHNFTELNGVIGGAAAGIVAGLIIWTIDGLRSKARRTDR